MASEDVIELGSSDEDTEPAPKKANTCKRRPNAMVQIPSGLTIKHPNRPINPVKKLIGKGVTITKVKPNQNIKQNGKNSINMVSKMPQIQNIRSVGTSSMKPMPIKNASCAVFNPMSVISNAKAGGSVNKLSVPVFPTVKIQNVSSLNNLPASITVKKTPAATKLGPKVVGGLKPFSLAPKIQNLQKRPAPSRIQNVKKKQKCSSNHVSSDCVVNLDDEETPTTSTGPQWYLRPEDSTSQQPREDPLSVPESDSSKEVQNMEVQNNTEPNNFVEITIEDSPIKPISNKRAHEIGAELAITIDDSPVKVIAKKSSAGSDNENSEQPPQERHSKKRLDYPQGVEIEIEFEPIQINDNDKINDDNSLKITNKDKTIDKTSEDDTSKKTIEDDTGKKISEDDNSQKSSKEDISKKTSKETPKPVKKNEKEVIKSDVVIEILDSPAKTADNPPKTPQKGETSQIQKVKPIAMIHETKQLTEFHPIYQEFIDLCLKLEKSDDMNTIVEKKIKGYYRQVPKEYTESEEFVELVQSKLFAMRASPEKLYLYIKDVVDELNMQRKMAKAKPTVDETRTLEAEKFQYGEDSEFDSKRQRQIRKLEKTLKKLHRAIQKLEEQEVDFDDEEDSVYLLTESDGSSSSFKDLDKQQLERKHSVLLKRYKERMVRVHQKFCQLTNTRMPSEPHIQIQARQGQAPGPAKRLEKWINKKVPIGTPLPFPDFHDVLKCVRDANSEDKLGWNEADIMDEARDLFTRCGKKLQRRRQENEWRLAVSRIATEVDPAEESDELKKKLELNRQMASKKETDVFNKFADKQSLLNLEAVEIGDKEADESPVESEDEEPHEEKDATLENKEKRKERLRRLIQEKNKKHEAKEKEQNESSLLSEIDANKDDGNNDTTEKEINNAMEVDSITEDSKGTNDGQIGKSDDQITTNDEVHSISEDSKIDSEVDELHLLQKLHSDEVNTSTIESSDSDSPIDISDTISSDNKKTGSDVISIENSTYSESETKDDATSVGASSIVSVKEADSESKPAQKSENVTTVADRLSGEIECSTDGITRNKTNNEEYNESVESILLASSDEEVDDKNESPIINEELTNAKDDDLSVGETSIEQIYENRKAISNESKEPVCINAGRNTLTGGQSSDSDSNKPEIESDNILQSSEKQCRTEKEHNVEAMDIPLIELDNSQEASQKNEDAEIGDQQLKKTDINSVETLEFDHSDETTKPSEDISDDKLVSAGTLRIVALESDNSQDAENCENVVMAELDSQQPDSTDAIVETLPSDNSQFVVNTIEKAETNDSIKGSIETLNAENSPNVADNDAKQQNNDDSQSIRTKTNQNKIHEVTDSSPDQTSDQIEKQIKTPVDASKDEIHSSVDSGKNKDVTAEQRIDDDIEGLKKAIEELRSQLAVKESSATSNSVMK